MFGVYIYLLCMNDCSAVLCIRVSFVLYVPTLPSDPRSKNTNIYSAQNIFVRRIKKLAPHYTVLIILINNLYATKI